MFSLLREKNFPQRVVSTQLKDPKYFIRGVSKKKSPGSLRLKEKGTPPKSKKELQRAQARKRACWPSSRERRKQAGEQLVLGEGSEKTFGNKKISALSKERGFSHSGLLALGGKGTGFRPVEESCEGEMSRAHKQEKKGLPKKKGGARNSVLKRLVEIPKGDLIRKKADAIRGRGINRVERQSFGKGRVLFQLLGGRVHVKKKRE